MSKIKLMTIVGTRPELIKLSRVIAEADKHFDHKIVHTGQNYDYELNQIFFEELGIRKPDVFLNIAGTPAETIGRVIIETDKVIEEENPDAVLIYGDTNSCLSVISAKRRKVPIFHMEAGNRCFDQRVPEELNRKIVDHLSDINMPLTEHARRYLIDEGIRPETIIKTGSTMKEILEHYKPEISKSDVVSRLKLKEKKYFIVSAHREENVDNKENLQGFVDSLNALASHYDMPVIVSTHPRTKNRMEQFDINTSDERIHFMKPMGFYDYVKMQEDAFCVISDSGTITEESSILDFPAIMIRKAHERPEGMDEGSVIMAGLSPERVIQAVSLATSHGDMETKRPRLIEDYNVDNVSIKVVRTILSYVDFVNRTVWHKE